MSNNNNNDDDSIEINLGDKNILPAGMNMSNNNQGVKLDKGKGQLDKGKGVLNKGKGQFDLPSIKEAGGNVENPFTFDFNDEEAKQQALNSVTDDMSEEQRMEAIKKLYKDNDIFEKHKEKWDQLTDEQKDEYQEMGEQIYSCMNEDGTMKDPLDEALLYINHGLDSGLHPKFLEKNELQVLQEKLGKKWYEKWNWTEEDMKEVTIDPDEIDEM